MVCIHFDITDVLLEWDRIGSYTVVCPSGLRNKVWSIWSRGIGYCSSFCSLLEINSKCGHCELTLDIHVCFLSTIVSKNKKILVAKIKNLIEILDIQHHEVERILLEIQMRYEQYAPNPYSEVSTFAFLYATIFFT